MLFDHVAIVNPTLDDLTLVLYASDADPAQTAGFDLLGPDETPQDVGAWIELSEQTVQVPAQGHVVVPFRLHVPDNATPGDHAGGIVAVLRTPASTTDTSLEVERRVGTRVYLNVDGPQRPQLDVTITQSSHEQNGWLPWGTVRLTLDIANTGNTRLAGSASTHVTALFGFVRSTTTSTSVPELLPGQRTTLHVELPDIPALGLLEGTVQVTANVVTVPGDELVHDAVSAESATALWAVPWPTVILILLLVAAVVAIMSIRRRAHRHRVESASQPAA